MGDSTDVSSPELAFVFGTLKSLCGIDQAATVKSVRTAGCFGAGTSPGWWKVGTVVATSIAAYALVFHVEFKQEEHVFSGLRRWHSRTVDRLFGLDRRTQPKQIENAAPVAAARQQD